MLRHKLADEIEEPSIDIIFRQLIGNIKTCSKNLLNPEERKIVSSWINKLCESALPSNPETERKNCNLYAQILLKMLQRTELKRPFSVKPSPGKLPTIPVYMSSYLDETEDFDMSDYLEPKWLRSKDFNDSMLLHSFNYDTKLDDDDDDVEFEKYTLPPKYPYISYPMKKAGRDVFQIPEADELEFYLKSQEKSFADLKQDIRETAGNRMSPLGFQVNSDLDDMNFEDDDCSVTNKFEDVTNKYRYSSVKHIHDVSKEKALEMKLELLEQKIEVESSKIQQQQSVMVKNILDRKNNEISDIKLFYQKKMAESDAVIQARDDVISTSNNKFNEAQLQHDEELCKLKSIIQERESMEKCAKEYEKSMTEKIADMENEMKNLKRCHFQNVEKLVEENERNILSTKQDLEKKNGILNANISKLTEQVQITEQIKEEALAEVENFRRKEDDDKNEISRLNGDLLARNSQLEEVQMEHIQLIGEHKKTLLNVQQKAEKTISNMKNDAAKTSTINADLETKIVDYKDQMQKIQVSKKSELKDMSIANKEKLVEFESMTNKKIQRLHNDLEAKQIEYNVLLEEYTRDVKEKENEISNLRDKLLKQSNESEKAIELMKTRAEEHSSSMFKELSNNLLQLQSSLTESREKIEQQRADNVVQLEEQKMKYETKLSKYKRHMEEMHSKLQESYDLEITEHAENVSKRRLEYEEKLRGLLPLCIKVELEDTIESMRQQIVLLQSQVDLLQEELDVSVAFNKSVRTKNFEYGNTALKIYNE